MNYFISKQIYNLVNNCKLTCREMNFTPYVGKIRFNTQFLWKYRYVLNWSKFTQVLTTESQLIKFDKFTEKSQVKIMDVSEDYIRKYINELPSEIIFAKQRSNDFLIYYMVSTNKYFDILLKTQDLTSEILLKYRDKWRLEDILKYAKNLPSSLVEYMIMTDVEIRGNPVYNNYYFSKYVDAALRAGRTFNRSFLELNIRLLSEDTVQKLISKNYRNRYFIYYKSNDTIRYDDWLKIYNETQKTDEANWM